MGKVKGRLLEAPSKEQRQKDRQKLGSLKSLTVSSKTRVRYEKAREKFYAFLRENDLKLPRKRELLDGLLAEYIEHLWSSGEGRALGADTIAGLQDIDPKVKGHLQASWRLLKTWGINEIPNRAPPSRAGRSGDDWMGLLSSALFVRRLIIDSLLRHAAHR